MRDVLILIIDDDCDMHALLKFFFKKKGIMTFHATTLKEAKLRIGQVKPRYILLDNQLPDGKGIDFIPFLKVKLPDSVIIATTAYLPVESKKKAMINGADFFLEKPFSCDQIKDLCIHVA
jgi:DNA-binding response OmpR family regulator